MNADEIITRYEDLWRTAALGDRRQFFGGTASTRKAGWPDPWLITGKGEPTCAALIAEGAIPDVATRWICSCGHNAASLQSSMVHLNNEHRYGWDWFANKFRDAWREGVERASTGVA